VLTDAGLSNWNNSIHEVFNSFPANFTPVVQANDAGNLPYILASNGQTSQTQTVNDDPETPTTFSFQGGPDGGG
jgi:hypothetical protein